MAQEARKLLGRLLENSGDFIKDLHLCVPCGSLLCALSGANESWGSAAAASIVGTTFGIEVQPEDDSYVLLTEKALHGLSMVVKPGTYLGELSLSCL